MIQIVSSWSFPPPCPLCWGPRSWEGNGRFAFNMRHRGTGCIHHMAHGGDYHRALLCVLVSTHSYEHHRYGASYYCVAWSWIRSLPVSECIADQLEGHHPPFHRGVWPDLQEGQGGRHGHYVYTKILCVYTVAWAIWPVVHLVLLKMYKVAWFLCAMNSNGIIRLCQIVVVYIRSLRFIVACFQLNYGELDARI